MKTLTNRIHFINFTTVVLMIIVLPLVLDVHSMMKSRNAATDDWRFEMTRKIDSIARRQDSLIRSTISTTKKR